MLFQWINKILLDTWGGNNRSKHSRCDMFFSTVLGFEIWAWQWVCEAANRTFYRCRNEAGECDLWKIYPFDHPEDALFFPLKSCFKGVHANNIFALWSQSFERCFFYVNKCITLPSAVCDIGSASFKYDMRRLSEILAFPRAWYRRSIARRLFLGDQTINLPGAWLKKLSL